MGIGQLLMENQNSKRTITLAVTKSKTPYPRKRKEDMTVL